MVLVVPFVNICVAGIATETARIPVVISGAVDFETPRISKSLKGP